MTNDAFLRAICEDPNDDALRLVYADWLDEHDQPARAEFIRLQVERSRLPEDDSRQEALQQRQSQLLFAFRDVWLGQLPRLRGIVWHRFWRGFVSGADVQTWKYYRRHADALF